MKTTRTKWLWLAIMLMAFAGVVRADNPCIEGGPYYSSLTCSNQGTLSPGYVLSPTNITVGVGQIITPPTVSNLAITNGLETCYVWYDCTPELDGPRTNKISYTFGNVYLTPAISLIWTPGTYTYTAKVIATGSPCSPLTNTLGTVTITVASNTPDVLLDVDFGGRTSSAKTGYAAIGDLASDFWNEYAKTNVSSGSLTNLLTAEGNVSPVGLLVTNLPITSTNGSSDAMYKDYLGTNSGTATLTLTNLPAGTWNVCLYADDGNFTVSVGGNSYGTRSCYDASPTNQPAWQPGVQYIPFQIVIVTNGQPLTVTINPGTNGTAMISGLQIASTNHVPQPISSAQSSVVAWGLNDYSQTNIPAGLNNVVAIASGWSYNLALKSDGTVAGWGYNGDGTTSIPAGLNNVTAIAAGWYHSMALKSDGTVVAWGNGLWGQTNVPTGLNNVVAIAAGGFHSLALKSDGTVAAWGDDEYDQTFAISHFVNNVVAIAAGGYHSLALKSDGTVSAWNGIPAGLSNVVAIAGGVYHSLALKNDGTVVAWGDNTYGQTNVPAGLSNVVAIAAGGYHSMALKSDGTVVAWGDNAQGQANVPAGLSSVVAIAAGDFHSLVLLNPTVPASEIPYLYKAGAPGALNLTLDSDHDGVSDLQELADRTNPNDTNSNPTNVTYGGPDGLPDWWEWYWFGNYSYSGTNLDANGNTFLSDYQNGVDPNVILFTIGAANIYVNATNPSVQLNITGGVPYYYAILINNQTTTNWLAYVSSNITVNLGTTDGVYRVNVGFRGLPANATQTWDNYSFTVDRVAPVLTITNPVLSGATNTVITPYLQLQGFANEPLSGLSYDISNATGIATNLDANVTDQHFDTNAFDFTTNWFQAYDVPLTNGVNNITLRVADRAGNMTTTNFNVTLDYTGATNPVIALTWPTNGMQICGGSFTLRGTVDDPSAVVVASITDTNGDTNIVTGSVERSGVLWVQNLPLAEGTNLVTLWVTNAAGLSSGTNLCVVKSDMTLALTSISGDLWMPMVNVGGSISDPSYSVFVNGVQATNNGDGTWGATNVPISSSGVASFDISASSGGGDPDYSTNVLKDPAVEIVQYGCGKSGVSTDSAGNTSVSTGSKGYNAVYAQNSSGGWFLQAYMGASSYYNSDSSDGGSWNQTSCGWSSLDRDTFSEHITDSGGDDNYYTAIPMSVDEYGQLTGVPDEDLQEFGEGGEYGIPDGVPPRWVSHYYANNLDWIFPYPDGSKTEIKVDASTQMKLFIGGMAGVGHQNLIKLQCSAVAYGPPPGGWLHTPQTNVPSSSLWALGKNVGSDGKLWVVEPDGAALDLGLTAKGYPHYNAGATATKYPVTITDNDVPLDPNTVNVTNCVGQNVTFALNNLPIGNITSMAGQWSLPAKFVNQQTNYSATCSTYVENDNLLQNTNVTSCWFYNGTGGKVSVGLNLLMDNGQSVNVAAFGNISVYRPSVNFGLDSAGPVNCTSDGLLSSGDIIFHATVTSTDFSGDLNWVQLINRQAFGNGQWLDNTFGSYYLDNVPFYNTGVGEDGNTFVGSGIIATNNFNDRPTIQCEPINTWISDSFKTYLVFHPQGDGIWVTLGRVDWGWSGAASYVLFGSFFNWELYSGSLTSPHYTDTDEFPVYPDVLHNH